MYRIFFISIFILYCYANNDISIIESKPSGIARDFYIYNYLINNKVSTDDMLKLYNLINNKNTKIMKLINIPTNLLPLDKYCSSLSYDKLLLSDDDCFNLGFKLKYALENKLDYKVKNRIKNKNLLDSIKILESKDILNTLLKESGEKFALIYAEVPNVKIFNKNIKNPKLLNDKNYYKTIYNMLISKKYPKFMKSLLQTNIKNVNDFTFFALALNELLNGNKSKAIHYFKETAMVTKNHILRDKATFWEYKLTNNKDILIKLSKSNNFNLYSLYAIKKLKTKPKYEVISDTNPMFVELGDEIPFDIKDPFKWQILKEDIRKIKDKDKLLNITKIFYNKDTLPHLIYILNIYYGYSKEFFLMPYVDKLGILDNDITLLIYSIARQESYFIPTAISHSFAIGLMQILPSNVPHFAKEQGLNDISLDSMFDPEISLKFGKHYIVYLKKHFIHPLFIAYSYNGGPTFFRKYLEKNKSSFNKNNKYDPWISMEFIPYEESRNYGINVIANYIIYNDLFGNNIDIDSFLNETLR